jgi:uncharacterized integral membrane protein (TIGR00698 family)
MKTMRSLLGMLPGVLLLAAIGCAGKYLEGAVGAYTKSHHLMVPNVEYVLWAIVFGLLIANTIGVPKVFEAGVRTYEFWLKLGIVLLGSRFLVGDMLKLGGISLVLVAVEIVLSIWLMTKLGEWFGLKPKLVSLLAVGSSICGVSAIIAAKGAIEADEDDSSTAMLVILSLGAFALFTFPVVGYWLGMSDVAFGMWSGLAVDNTAEAVATGAIYSAEAGKVAVFAKTARNATIGVVVLWYAWYWAKQGLARTVEHKAAFLWEKFPKFVLGFLVLSSLASMGAFNASQLASLGNLSKWAFLLTFAGVGLRTNIRELLSQGTGPFVAGALGEFAIAGLTLALVLGTEHVFGL